MITHSQNSFFSSVLCFHVCTFVLFAAATSAYANSNSGPLPVAFDSSQAQSFHLDLTLVNATVSVSGGGSLKDAFFNPFGSDDIDFDLGAGSNQNKPLSLSGGTVHFVSTPNGSAILGLDHSNPNATGSTLAGLDVDFRNGANWAFNFNEVTFDVDTDVGDYDMGLKIRANLNQFLFAQDPGSTTLGTAGSFFAPGILTAGIAADVDARIKDIIFGADFSIGNLASFNESSLTAFNLPGQEILTPQGAFPSGPFPQDLLVALGADLSGFPLEFEFNESGTATQNDSEAVYSIPYSIQGTLQLSNLSYALEDTLVGAVVSELGDFDDDGDADGYDFLKWQRGESVDPLGAFALADWEANFGTGGAGPLSSLTAGIPEPSTFFLAGLGLSGMWACRRRR